MSEKLKCEPYKPIELKVHKPCVKYIAEDGEEFYDKLEYRIHCNELFLKKARIMYKESIFDQMGSWWFLLVFIVGYVFGVITMI